MDVTQSELTSLMSVARESIVLLTVVIVAVVAYFLWVKVVQPIMQKQAEIVTATADALRSIQQTTQSMAQASAAVESQSRQLAEASRHLVELTSNLLTRKD